MDIKLKNLTDRWQREGKTVWLLANLKMDEYVDKWSIVISAPWVTEENQREMFQSIVGDLRSILDASELTSIARIVLMSKDEHIVEELLQKKSGDKLKDTPVNGNIIHEGYIIVSNPDAEIESPTQEPLPSMEINTPKM